MRPDALGERELGGHQHGGPDHAVEARDVLADHVELRGPAGGPVALGEAGAGEVVRQRVEPDVGALHLAVARGARERHAPAEPRARRRDVLETLLEEAEDLVAAARRRAERGLLDEERAQPVGVGREAEEPVALLRPLQLACRVQRAAAVDDLVLRLERFAADAVAPGVGLLVEGIGRAFEDARDERLHADLVGVGGGADELVVGEPEARPDRREARGDVVDERLRRRPRLLGRLGDLLAVLVHPDHEMDVAAERAMEPGDHVGADLLEGVADVGIAVGVVDGGRQVEARHGCKKARGASARRIRSGHAGGGDRVSPRHPVTPSPRPSATRHPSPVTAEARGEAEGQRGGTAWTQVLARAALRARNRASVQPFLRAVPPSPPAPPR